jgi:hypothetical protein
MRSIRRANCGTSTNALEICEQKILLGNKSFILAQNPARNACEGAQGESRSDEVYRQLYGKLYGAKVRCEGDSDSISDTEPGCPELCSDCVTD